MFDPFLTVSSAIGILFEIMSTTIAAFLLPIETLVLYPLASILGLLF